MKKNPIHFYWGRKNGLVVTREDADLLCDIANNL